MAGRGPTPRNKAVTDAQFIRFPSEQLKVTFIPRTCQRRMLLLQCWFDHSFQERRVYD
jgi:hypothetical protein